MNWIFLTGIVGVSHEYCIPSWVPQVYHTVLLCSFGFLRVDVFLYLLVLSTSRIWVREYRFLSKIFSYKSDVSVLDCMFSEFTFVSSLNVSDIGQKGFQK